MILLIPLVFSKLHEATNQVTNYNIYQAILRSMSHKFPSITVKETGYILCYIYVYIQLCPKFSIDEFQTHMHLLSFQDIWATVHSLHVCTLAVKMALTLNFYGDSGNIDDPCYKTLLRSIQLPNFNSFNFALFNFLKVWVRVQTLKNCVFNFFSRNLPGSKHCTCKYFHSAYEKCVLH